jgi:tryptophan 2,3-dioxygenase
MKSTTPLISGKNSSNSRWRPENPELIKAMRHFDHTVNITWVMQHLNVAIKYIEQSGKGTGEAPEEVIEKIHAPKIPAKDIFSELWSAEELANWGVEI